MRGALFATVAAFLSLPGARGQSPILIDESAIRAVLENESTNITVPIENALDRGVRANLSLDWIDKDQRTVGSARQGISIPPGRTTVTVPLPIQEPSIWLRLRYSLVPERGDARSFAPQLGTVALPQVDEHIFELKVSHVGAVRPGLMTIHAQAVHPVTREPVQGVKWNARLTANETGLSPVKISSHAEGMVDFVFDVPPAEGAPDDQAKVWVQARRGDFVSDVVADIPFSSGLSGRLQTDKPIYQPGQTMHIRAVVLDPQGRSLEGAKITVRIEDKENDKVHTAQLISSRFGVIQDDWTLPATAGLGAYEIALAPEGDEDFIIASHTVRVNRYELPTFKVIAKSDRAVYLPGQQARVFITGTYLFGKPAPKGKVKVTRSGRSQWNPKTHTLESTNETVAEGYAGEDGTYVAELDLQADHDDLGSSPNQRFQDLNFAAYYTDPSSGRTEQRRFDVRITREPIHVYLIGTAAGGTLPTPLYVSTSYADGRPASSAVELRYQGQTATLRTNQYGVGRAFVTWDREKDGDIEARATDGNGQIGTWSEHYWRSGPEYLRLETDRTIYRTGEPVSVRISAPKGGTPDEFVMLNALAGDRSVTSRIVRLTEGKAEVTFPFQPEFRRTVVFVAWNAASIHTIRGQNTLGTRAVVFPDTSALRVTAAAERAVYRPGEKATLRMQVNSTDGHPVAAALGLAVVDQAVLEHARTDNEFGQRPWFACAFCRDDGETEIGGVRLNDLYRLKPATPISPGMDLVAEALVARAGAVVWSESSESLENTPRFEMIDSQLEKLRESLDRRYAQTLEFPTEISSLAGILGRQWSDLRDPWGMPYAAKFHIEGDENVISLISSGPDKLPGNRDDFVAGTFRRSYVSPVRILIRRILSDHGDYPASEAELRDLLSANGLLLDSLRDPWGTPYRARVTTRGAMRYITILSAGPDRRFETPDDFLAAYFFGVYFEREKAELTRALNAAPESPWTIEEFQRVLEKGGIDISKYRDAWGRPYRVTSATSSRYADKVSATTVRTFGGPTASRTEITPVTQRLITFALHSAGPDGLEDTYDDFDVARFVTVLKEESAAESPETHSLAAALARGAGAITGVVTDVSGAVIPDAKVVLIDPAGISYETSSGQAGVYWFVSVPPGLYSLRASSPGFNFYEIRQIPVTGDKTTAVDIQLQVGSVSETVNVEASVVALNTQAAAIVAAAPIATPRVRDYFPETLLWMPEILTDEQGSARTQFALADSVTTWKVAAIASTLDGRMAETDSELRSFQPFFLDFNPPPVLTEGDRIDLPVTIRNYQDREQKVGMNLQANDWSTVQGPAGQELTVSANSSANAIYSIQAKNAKDAARQRITAIAGRNRDAIEKSLHIHPDGQEVTQTVGDLIAGPAALSISVPSNAISGATKGELRLYPNIASMLLESAAAILVSPHGCAEQTISAGYANLVALRYARAAGIRDPRIDKLASANISAARDSLAGFEAPGGGIRYWASGEPDIGVTAYALSFLVDASGIVPVDKDDLQSLAAWLQREQAKDGRWVPQRVDAQIADRQATLLTGLVVRSLAGARKTGVEVQASVLAAAYHHIAQFTDQLDEPYLLAQFILAALDSGDEALLSRAATRLASLARQEKGGFYWDLRTNSPFYGWGTAGRFETTGLVVSALSAWRSRHVESTELDSTIGRGLVFLLRGRDRFGSWYSTQSTVRVMRAMADASTVLGDFGGGGRVEIRLNGRLVKTVSMPADPRSVDPVILDISAFLAAGDNRLELTPSPGTQTAMLRFSSIHWLPWTQTKARNSNELRFSVEFDRLEARAGEQVRCSVKAERVGFRGYGMMLAEIGLPPGAEVDRASLESFIDDASLGVNRYDVLPDRILFYVWPRAGGASFDFYLHARIAMTAKSTPSVLYDYYNPEALSEIPPFRWVIK